jgi:hypothetical protein
MPGSQFWKVRDGLFDGEQPLASYDGGLRHGRLANWTAPMVRLSIYTGGIELGPSESWLKIVVPYFQASFSQIVVAEAVGLSSLSSGVRIRVTDGDYRIFWTWRRNDVLADLSRLGVEIDPLPRAFNRLFPSQ